MRKLFVMGGGGFAMEPENPALDRYLLSLAEVEHPRVCFIGTASGDSDRYHHNFYSAYKNLHCVPSHLALFKPPTRDLASFIAEKDVIHVGGGNTKNLLCLWREWGLDKALRAAYENGTVLSGMSAGMICWFEHGVTDSFGDALEPLKGLGWLKGSACPHFDGEAERRPSFSRMIRDGTLPGGIALNDGVGALFLDENLEECVSSRGSEGAFLFSSSGEERSLPVRYLGHDVSG
jgi:peptidase E